MSAPTDRTSAGTGAGAGAGAGAGVGAAPTGASMSVATGTSSSSSPVRNGASSPTKTPTLTRSGSSMSSARSNGLKPNGPGAKSSAKEVAATLANLEAAEALLHAVLEHTESAVEHIESRSLGQRVNLPQLSKTGDNLISTLDEVHDRLSREIPNLVKYVPFERSSYGKKKDAAIAQGKLDFARNHLARTLELIDEPSPTEGAVTAPNQT